MKDDLHLSALISTRLCHDMAGPVGAVAAGVELLSDDLGDADLNEETVALLKHSAQAASARLKFLRAAFGVPGKVAGYDDVKTLVADYVDAVGGVAVRLDWAVDLPPRDLEDSRLVQLTLNLALAAMECLGGSGVIRVSSVKEGGLVLSARAEGPRTALETAARSAIEGRVVGLTPRTVSFYLLRLLAASSGGVRVVEDHRSVTFICQAGQLRENVAEVGESVVR